MRVLNYQGVFQNSNSVNIAVHSLFEVDACKSVWLETFATQNDKN